MLLQQGQSFRLFRFAGIQVYLHWSWLLVAAIELMNRRDVYSSPLWNVIEYLSLFGIVLLHEFGHALACRQVGGQAHQIVLWPLGGVAFVSPPPRPGAVLWSIAAGPLVNVVLIPILLAVSFALNSSGLLDANPDLAAWLWAVSWINVLLLVFNLLPVYPLDGGQILRSLLWFAVGPRRSLRIAAAIGLVGVAGLLGLALWTGRLWTGILAAFIGVGCWQAFQASRDPGPPSAP